MFPTEILRAKRKMDGTRTCSPVHLPLLATTSVIPDQSSEALQPGSGLYSGSCEATCPGCEFGHNMFLMERIEILDRFGVFCCE
jgi:hypothetical protein